MPETRATPLPQKVLYAGEAVVEGGRAGHGRTSDGRLEIDLSVPAEMGDSGDPSPLVVPPVLPVTRRLQALFASRVARVPGATRRLLLAAALDGSGNLGLLQRIGLGRRSLDDLGPAERAELACADRSARRLAFRHSLIRGGNRPNRRRRRGQLERDLPRRLHRRRLRLRRRLPRRTARTRREDPAPTLGGGDVRVLHRRLRLAAGAGDPRWRHRFRHLVAGDLRDLRQRRRLRSLAHPPRPTDPAHRAMGGTP